jgi:hypothetical protein
MEGGESVSAPSGVYEEIEIQNSMDYIRRLTQDPVRHEGSALQLHFLERARHHAGVQHQTGP